MLDKEVQRHILGLSDVALVEYEAHGTDYYQAEAIDFAKAELARRNIGAELKRIGTEQAKAKVAEDLAITTTGLTHVGKTLAFLGGFFCSAIGPLMFVIWKSAAYDTHGCRQKKHDLWLFWKRGLFTFLAFVVVSAMVQFVSR